VIGRSQKIVLNLPAHIQQKKKAPRSASNEITEKVHPIYYLGIHRSELTHFAHHDGTSSADLVEEDLKAATPVGLSTGQVAGLS
jgi:hypothetical protein